MQFQNLADPGLERQASRPRQNAPTQKTKAGTHSPQRILYDRLRQNRVTPRGYVVAMCLAAYTRDFNGLGASVYHAKIAAETGLSVETVRRGLKELTSGEAPLYVARGRSGQARTLRAKGNFQFTTRGVYYEWIEDLPAFLAARDTARAVNLLAFEERKQEVHADKVRLQAKHLTDQIDAETYKAEVEQIDAKARGNLPARAVQDPRPSKRCLTAKQIQKFSSLIVRWPDYATLQREGVDAKPLYGLRQHVMGDTGKQDLPGCQHCQDAVIAQWRVAKLHPKSGQQGQDRLKALGVEVVRCGCGEAVTRSDRHQAVSFWDAASEHSETPAHDCIHEQNRLMKLRGGGHR